MKPFEAVVPSFPAREVQAFRTREVDALVAAIGEVKAPVSDALRAEPIALAFAHGDAGVRKRAMALVAKHVPDAVKFKAAYRSLAGVPQHVVDQRVAAFAHPYRLDIAKAVLFHAMTGATVPFEEDAQVRGVLLDEMVAMAEREGEPVNLGQLYWYWRAAGGGSFTTLEPGVLPPSLFAELAARRTRHPFAGLSFSGAKVTTLPDAIATTAPWLTSLSLAHTGLTELPDVLWKLTNLESLDLTATSITDVPAGIARLPKLRNLGLALMKKMKSLPVSVCKLDKLERLNLSGGSIRSIPESLAEMTSLSLLVAPNVAKLPKCITAMPSLVKVLANASKANEPALAALRAAGVEVLV